MAVPKLLRRLAGHFARGLVMIWVVMTFTFVLIQLMPGDPVRAQYETLIAQGIPADQAERQTAITYGFVPQGNLVEQYVEYIGKLMRFDMGMSLSAQGVSVSDQVLSAAKWTVGLVLFGIIVSFLLGIVLGVIAAMRRATRLGDSLSIIGSLLHGIPQYIMALVLVTFLTVRYPLFSSGMVNGLLEPGWNLPYIQSLLTHAVLPATAFALSSFGGYLLAMKSSVVSVLGDDFILAAELRGMKRGIVFRYIARNALLPLFTVLALSFGFMFGGAVYIEEAFSYPGMGATLLKSIGSRDYTMMNGLFLVITAAVIVANILADILYSAIDPRVRRGEAT